MYTVNLSHRDIRVAAAALAEAARKRPRTDEVGKASRALARTLSEAYTLSLARGEVVLTLPEPQRVALSGALLDAASGPLWYGSITQVPQASFLRLAEQVSA